MNSYKFLFLIMLFALPLAGVAQEASTLPDEQQEVGQRNLDKKRWRNITKNLKYDTRPAKPPKERKQKTDPLNFKFGGNAAFAMKILIGALLAILLFFIIRSILGLNMPHNKKVNTVLSVEELEQLEENLHQVDLEKFIQRAIEQGNFALATRLYYLSILKELSLRNRIAWKKDKTNRDYLREMRSSPRYYDTFSDLTSIFERIWYGNVNLTRTDFQLIEPRFKLFLQKMEATSTVIIA